MTHPPGLQNTKSLMYYWFNVGSLSAMLAQHWVIVFYLVGALNGSMFTAANTGFTKDGRPKKMTSDKRCLKVDKLSIMTIRKQITTL